MERGRDLSTLEGVQQRYTSIDNGNFCTSDRKFVVGEVNSKTMLGKEPKTNAQMKNKINNLKKNLDKKEMVQGRQVILQASKDVVRVNIYATTHRCLLTYIYNIYASLKMTLKLP